MGPAPASLRGTEEDGDLRVDADGRLIVGPEVLWFFDYWFSTTGEESAEAIKARIVAAIQKKLGDSPAAKEALALLDKYIAYREAARSLTVDGEGLSEKLDALKKLRREHFGDGDADKLFGTQEKVDAIAIEEKAVREDASLSAAEKAERLADLDKELPESERAAREASMRPVRAREEEEAMRARGASEEEIRRHRVESWGEEATARLEELDRKRAEWRQRLEEFQQKRAELEAKYSDPREREAAVTRLFEESFSPQERIRVNASLRRLR